MSSTHRRVLGAGIAATAIAALVAGTPAFAGPGKKPAVKGNPNLTSVQVLSFNDYHGHLEATDGPLAAIHDPSATPVGGAEYLSTKLTELRSKVGDSKSLTVAAGDLIGGSPFLSGLFHDEPSVESLNAMGLDVSSVGNHEFDEGTDELLRMQNGGCHPVDGCYFPDEPYAGADFPWLAANVIKKSNGTTFLPGTWVKEISGTKVGFIGMTLEGTDLLVSPGGISSVTFKDEVETANAAAQKLKKQGVKAIVVLMHEGGANAGTYNSCVGISEPIATMATQFSPEIDHIVTGHTHNPYVCSIPDPAGNPRTVTSAADYGRVVTETNLVINTRSGEVDRGRTTSTNHLVTRTAKDPVQTEVIAKWKALSGELGAQVVGTHVEDIIGHSDPRSNRAIETPMGNLVADAILWGTSGDNGGAQIAFMNVGGVRASLPMAPVAGEGVGNITYAEAYAVAPFGNLLNTITMTGAQIKAVLEQQYRVSGAGVASTLSINVSEGFTYTWTAGNAAGSKVSDMRLNGVPLSMDQTYRVGTLSFLAQGGDGFSVFTQGTNLTGGPEDLKNLVDYFRAHPGLTAPGDRVAGL
ncbi:bifunctional metallophosphatase/5'-nucleotidase [Ornithinibacter aureus]|uniref:Bifunctional metallophosphatase/5'-nucleotidase n=1 Tax=Ornithinibacter aureus TaxID=622664 RepID=A0ABP8K162_9MICO|nr:bifunctional metallophosphatase/5'-nucleotidase [Ornithinibacter aureus]KAF0833097.1 5'-nucleotidase [Ornithinibacter aureus]